MCSFRKGEIQRNFGIVLDTVLDGIRETALERISCLETSGSGPKSSTIRPSESTKILLKADKGEARRDTTIKVEANRSCHKLQRSKASEAGSRQEMAASRLGRRGGS